MKCKNCMINDAKSDVLCCYLPCAHRICLKCLTSNDSPLYCVYCKVKLDDIDCKGPNSIRIQSIEGNTLDLSVNIKTTTVREVKFVLAISLSIPWYMINLYFDGRTLTKDNLLKDYGVRRNSTVFIDIKIANLSTRQ